MGASRNTIVPVIDLAEALAGDEHARRRCALELDAAAQGSGFFVITGHGVPDALIDDAVRVARAFFAQPVERKLELTTPMSYRGYQGMSATALAQTLGDESLPDLSESFNIGRYDDEPDVDGNPDAAAMCHPNLWPDEPVELRSVFRRYFEAMDALSAELLRLLAQALGAAPETYVSRNQFANSSMMLVNYYPAVDITPPPGQLRRGRTATTARSRCCSPSPNPACRFATGTSGSTSLPSRVVWWSTSATCWPCGARAAGPRRCIACWFPKVERIVTAFRFRSSSTRTSSPMCAVFAPESGSPRNLDR